MPKLLRKSKSKKTLMKTTGGVEIDKRTKLYIYKAYPYALSILPQRAKVFLISYLQYGIFFLNIKTSTNVLIDALRNISPSELKYVLFHIGW